MYYKGGYRAFWGSDGGAITKFGELPSNEGAEFYRVIGYAAGQIASVKDYYITGELEIGQYKPYCAEAWCANGLFTWYYKNGLMRQQQTFVDGVEQFDCNWAYVARVGLRWNDKGECVDRHCECRNQ